MAYPNNEFAKHTFDDRGGKVPAGGLLVASLAARACTSAAYSAAGLPLTWSCQLLVLPTHFRALSLNSSQLLPRLRLRIPATRLRIKPRIPRAVRMIHQPCKSNQGRLSEPGPITRDRGVVSLACYVRVLIAYV